MAPTTEQQARGLQARLQSNVTLPEDVNIVVDEVLDDLRRKEAKLKKLQDDLSKAENRQLESDKKTSSVRSRLHALKVLRRSDVDGLAHPSLEASGSYEKYQSDYLRWLALRDHLLFEVEEREAWAVKSRVIRKQDTVKPSGKAVEAEKIVSAGAVQAKAEHKKALKRAKNERRKIRKLKERAAVVAVKTKVLQAEVKMAAVEKRHKAVVPSYASVAKSAASKVHTLPAGLSGSDKVVGGLPVTNNPSFRVGVQASSVLNSPSDGSKTTKKGKPKGKS